MWQCSSKMDSALKEETGASISPVLKKRKCLIKSIHLKQNTKAEPLLGKLLEDPDEHHFFWLAHCGVIASLK